MSASEQLINVFDRVSKQLWEINLDGGVFEKLKVKCSQLSAQIAVLHSLQKTVSLVLGSTVIPYAQSRVCKFLDTLHGNTEAPNSTIETRWRQLRDLDCQTFLLIAVSYTPLEIIKMSRTEFDYLMTNAASYADSKSLPSEWIFRKEVQLAMVEKSDPPNVRPFKRRYHNLEFGDSPRKRVCPGADQVPRDTGGKMPMDGKPGNSPSHCHSAERFLPSENTTVHSSETPSMLNEMSQVNWTALKGAQSTDGVTAHFMPPAAVLHSVLELKIGDLIRFLDQFQDNCPVLKMTCPWLGVPLPFIDIPLNPSDYITARLEFSLQAGEAMVQYILGSGKFAADISH